VTLREVLEHLSLKQLAFDLALPLLGRDALPLGLESRLRDNLLADLDRYLREHGVDNLISERIAHTEEATQASSASRPCAIALQLAQERRRLPLWEHDGQCIEEEP